MNNKFLGKIALFSFLVIGLAGISSPSAFAAGDTKTNTAKTKKADTKSKKTVSSAKKSNYTKKDITQEKARLIALRKARGTVEKSEHKNNKGREVYEFAIKDAKGHVRDIWVDQKTGRVVRNMAEKGK